MLLDLEHPYKYFPSMVLKEEEILVWLMGFSIGRNEFVRKD